jgi:Na+-translocating ferredoxin:NAD+ oxidoreductase RnfA subunit
MNERSDHMEFGIVSVAAITVICYLVGHGIKVSGLDNKLIPLAVGITGGILGMVALYVNLPDFPADDPLTAVAVGIGFMLTMTLFAKLHNSLDEEEVPASFRGLPIALLTAGMIALALLALNF